MKHINDLNKVFSKRLLSKHEVLFREGDTLGDGYIINYGLISLEKNNKKVETLGEGEVLGVFNVFFDNKIRFFTAITMVKTEVFIIPEVYLKDKIRKADPFVKHCFRNWLYLTRKFMIEFDSENIVKNKKIRKNKKLEDYEKFKMITWIAYFNFFLGGLYELK